MSFRQKYSLKFIEDNYGISDIKNVSLIDYNEYLLMMSEKLKKWYNTKSLNEFSLIEISENDSFIQNGRIIKSIVTLKGIMLMGRVSISKEYGKEDLTNVFIKFLEKLTNKNLCSKIYLPFTSFKKDSFYYLFLIIMPSNIIEDSYDNIIQLYTTQFKKEYLINSKQYI